jgi:hypothetical protein
MNKMKRRITQSLSVVFALTTLTGVAQVNSSTDLTEDVTKRDFFTKHYEISDGKYQAVISGGPVHYMSNGSYLDINTGIIAGQNGAYFENKTNLIQSVFPKELGQQGIKVGDGEAFVTFGKNSRIEALSANGDILSVIETSVETEIEVLGNRASYTLFANGTSEYLVGNGELKNNLILTSLPSNIPTQSEFVTFTESLTLPTGWKLIGEGEEINSERIIGSGIGIFNEENELVYQIPVPDVYEEMQPENAIYADGNWRASYKVTPLANDQFELATLVPTSWLLEQGRQFPVVIDPTITVAGSFGGWQNSSSSYNDATFYVFTANNYSSTTYRAWTKWNISSIPTGSIVLNSELLMYCNGGVAGVDTINVNDVTGTYGNYGSYNSSAYADFANGNYIQFVTNGVGQNYGYYDLGSTCDGDIEDEIGNTWFQLAFTMAPGTSNWKRFTATSSNLRIEYVQCSGQLGGSVTTSGLNSFGHHVDCFGDTTASITAVGSGGSNYTYTWSGPNGFTSTAGTISDVGAGQYSVTIYSGTICPAYVDTTILSPEQLFINDSTSNYSGFDVSCFDGSDGEIYLSPTGSSGAYTYAWNGPSSFTSTSQNITGLERGMYYVTLTEGNASCTTVDSVNMTSPLLLELILDNKTEAYCEFDENGTAEVHGVGGVQAYSYSWDNGETTAEAIALPAGLRTVTITDANGCSNDMDVEIGFEFFAPDVDLGNADTGYCEGGSMILNAGGGYQAYLWSDGSTGQLLQVTGLGTYSVTCTTFGGCEGEDAINVIEEYALPEPDLGSNINAPTSPVVITPGIYDAYVWNTGSLDSAITVSIAGDYSVTVTDIHGCKGEDEVNVKFWTTGMDEMTNAGISIYPNPASDVLYISGNSGIELNKVEVINAQGQLVLIQNLKNQGPLTELNVGALPQGVYVLRFEDDTQHWSTSFVKN